MLTEVCQEIKNWFDDKQPKFKGEFVIKNGYIQLDLQEGQYFRIIGSVFNDGVYQYPTYDLQDETFKGEIRGMAIPKSFLNLVENITAWCDKYDNLDSNLMSPFSSESFGGYSYTKQSSNSSSGSSSMSWQSVFANKLKLWRKI